jgi:hypothetical protein
MPLLTRGDNLKYASPLLPGILVLLLAVRGVSAQEQAAPFPLGDLSLGSEPALASASIVVPDSVRLRAGYQHWRGAALGAGIGGVLGALTGAIAGGSSSCDDCSRQPTAGSGALVVGALGAGLGSVVGFLVGLASPKYVWTPRTEVQN